jgi:flavodoxin
VIKQNKDQAITSFLRPFFTTKVFIIYDTKYGNTKLAAEQIAEGLKESEGIETVVDYVKNIKPQKIADCDALVFGAPNHMGKPSRTMTKFIDSLSKVELNGKYAAAFDTYFQRGRYFEKAMKKLEKQINCKLPKLKLISPGLSIKVNGVNGPIADGELPKAKEFGKRIALLIV